MPKNHYHTLTKPEIRHKYCECGNVALRRYNGEFGCERCIAIEKKWAYTDELITKERKRREADFYETGLAD